MTAERGRGRLFGTTADLGMSVTAPDIDALFTAAGETLAAGMCDRRTVRTALERRVALKAGALDALLVAWLNELIYLFDAEGFLVRRCRVAVRGRTGLRATVAGERCEPGRHRLLNAFKAATWHDLSVREARHGWRARVILDV
jgi:SHS2 domain-containing protein